MRINGNLPNPYLRPTAAAQPAAQPAEKAADGTASSAGFTNSLLDAFRQANELQLEAEQMSKALAAGRAEDLHSVMLAAEKANLSLQFTLQIRNKVIEAYQEIMRIQV